MSYLRTDLPINAHSSLMTYFKRHNLYKDKLSGIHPIRKMMHPAAVRCIIMSENISFFELLCCDMVMCYFPGQFTLYQRQKCYDLLVNHIPNHPHVVIKDGNILEAVFVKDGKTITSAEYEISRRVFYLDNYDKHK